ncbi:MAG: hypothetical protein WC346_04710 [Methanogenium sp.]|jgi:hypothetical protein
MSRISNIEKWDIALSKMVDAFDLLCKDRFYNDEEYKTIDKGLKLFSKWYMDLWT